jgi:hypothetical protein
MLTITGIASARIFHPCVLILHVDIYSISAWLTKSRACFNELVKPCDIAKQVHGGRSTLLILNETQCIKS